MMTKEAFLTDISKWLYNSVCEHFSTKVHSEVFPMHIQGQDIEQDEKRKKDFFEIRTDGPHLSRLSPTRFDLEYQVNTLIHSTLDDKSFDRPYVDMGKVLPAFLSIPIYKYGGGPQDDDETLIGCLRVTKQGRKDAIRVSQFGVIDVSLGLIQATVEAHYHLEIDLKKL